MQQAFVSMLFLCLAAPLLGQVFTLTKERMTDYTADSPFERFADGRPKVPDELLEQMRSVGIEEAFPLLRQKGFLNQYEGGWRALNPGPKIVGRAFTAQFMPARPDVVAAMEKEAAAKGIGPLRNQTVIDMLQPGDVIVVDLFGKTEGGTFVGDKLAYYIWKTTGTGVVVDGGLFYLDNIRKTGMPAYFRGSAPGSLANVMLTGINVPIRVGSAIVMPGDVVIGDESSIFFVPPQFVKPVIEAAADAKIRGDWVKEKFDTGKYKSREIYGRPKDPALQRELEELQKKRKQ